MDFIKSDFKELKIGQETILYRGNPDLDLLKSLAAGPGDLWHSGADQGYGKLFPEIVYQTHVSWWYVQEFETVNQHLSWRLNPNQFAVRKSVWEHFKGFDTAYHSETMQGFSMGYQMLRNGAVPLYIPGLFPKTQSVPTDISPFDIFRFFRTNFRSFHSYYLLLRKGIFRPHWWFSFLKTINVRLEVVPKPYCRTTKLNDIGGSPRVSYIIPTMMRQTMTVQLLDDLKKQSYPPAEVIVVDATPDHQRVADLYNADNYPFELKIKWQTSKGSCRARNEALDLASGDYIVFGDDDIRIPIDFIANHIRFMQTFGADACNGLDLRADHHLQGQDDLQLKRNNYPKDKLFASVSNNFNNANSCITRKVLDILKGNDVNYDGGYGEDSDFGISIVKAGFVVFHNPWSVNLHLKPPSGGYRFWGAQSRLLGKKRKQQPWELNHPVGWVRPVPSPTIMYQVLKHFNHAAFKEYRIKHMLHYLSSGSLWSLPIRIFRIPYKLIQFRRSVFYARELIKLGIRYR